MAMVAVGAALCFAMISETISWFLIYRHDDYKRQVEEIVELQSKVDLVKEKMQYSLGTQSLNQ